MLAVRTAAMRRLRLASLLALAPRACGATTAPFIPLSAATLDSGIRLAVSVSLVAPDGSALPEQQLALDTGSSTVAFCRRALGEQVAQETVSVNETKVVSCTMYNLDDAPDGYWGYLYQGPVQLGQAQPPVVVKSAFYTVMQVQMGMPCDENFQGLFGIAYKPIDEPYAYWDDLQRWTVEGVNASCPTRTVEGAFAPPVEQLLQEAPLEPRLVGLYWSGQVGPKAGELYLHSAATANPRYAAGKLVGSAALGALGWYNVDVHQIALSGAGGAGPWKNIDCSEEGGDACMIDLGTPGLVVPRPIMAAITDLRNSSGPLGTISFTLGGAAGGAPVELGFDLATLVERGWISAGDGTEITLGLPLWASYYTVFDLAGGAATFVALASGGAPAAAAAPSGVAAGGGARRLSGASGTFV